MIKFLKIINFKSISKIEIFPQENINNIVWKNWAWKTNILQAICFLFLNNFSNLKIEEVLKNWENVLYLEAIFENNIWETKLVFTYDKESQKKQFLLNWKKVSKKILFENIIKITHFFPINMNLFFLWPKFRRDFLDEIIGNSFQEYWDLLKKYEEVVKNRNKILKNIYEWNSKKSDLEFRDNIFLELCKKIYNFRFDICEILNQEISNMWSIFQNKVDKIELKYLTKVDKNDIENSIKIYLQKNLDRDIILWKTNIWPHLDDFLIFLDDKEITNFASRWETKSIIIELKLVGLRFIEKTTNKKSIIIIDDFSSELDEEHQEILLNHQKNKQIFITSILPLNKENIEVLNI